MSRPVMGIVAACAALLLGSSWGCGAREFRLNREGRQPDAIGRVQEEEIAGALGKLFGTPDEPVVPQGTGLRLELLRRAAGPIRGDSQGAHWGLYRRHCTACHGTSGDGAGPVAALMDPYPRDFRTGGYKYTSTAGGAKPDWADLDRIMRQGIPDTSMPSFATLPDDEIEALIEYVEYLSIRGETERFLLQLVVDEDEYPVDRRQVVAEGLLPAVEAWADAPAYVVVPPARPPTDMPEQLAASAARGHDLYVDTNVRCIVCHGPGGEGDGEQSELYDDWNKGKRGATAEETRRLAARFVLPIQQVNPRNYTRGVFRGGRRPVDLYWRICVGIKGTPMPAAGPALGNVGVLTEEEIWHVVNYVRRRAGMTGQ